MTAAGWIRCFIGIVWREGLRFIQQRSRFVSALVRPLIWLFVFARTLKTRALLPVNDPYFKEIFAHEAH